MDAEAEMLRVAAHMLRLLGILSIFVHCVYDVGVVCLAHVVCSVCMLFISWTRLVLNKNYGFVQYLFLVYCESLVQCVACVCVMCRLYSLCLCVCLFDCGLRRHCGR